MEKEYVSYEIAIALKELGFDEPCFGWYNYGTLCLFREDNLLDCYAGEENRPLTPTYSQAFRWFRENYNIESWVSPYLSNTEKEYNYFIVNRNVDVYDITTSDLEYKSYEQAELECLKKLIEIVKNGKD